MDLNYHMNRFETTMDDLNHTIKQGTSQIIFDKFTRDVEASKRVLTIYDHNEDMGCDMGDGILYLLELDLFSALAQCQRALPTEMQEDVYPTNQEELMDYFCAKGDEATKILEPFMRQHPYLDLFPPVFKGSYAKGLEHYFLHLYTLQREFQLLVDHCFDANYHREELSQLTAIQRFYLYTCIYPEDYPEQLTQRMCFSRAFAFPFDPETAPSHYEIANELPAGLVAHLQETPMKLVAGYECKSVYEVLSVELYTMLHHDIRVKKCKNCGHYFVVKGKHDSDYCTRIMAGETQTCQKIAATQTFQQKVGSNDVYKLFQRFYKRYHARMKVGTVKPDAFKKWNMEACTKRDLCAAGNLELADFQAWLEGSFPNRPTKKQAP